MTPPTHTGDRAGVTLVELLVALTIIALVIPALLVGSGLSASHTVAGHMDGAWVEAVQERVEQLRLQGFDSVQSGAETTERFDLSWTVSGSDPKVVTLSVTPVPPMTGRADTLIVLFSSADTLAGAP